MPHDAGFACALTTGVQWSRLFFIDNASIHHHTCISEIGHQVAFEHHHMTVAWQLMFLAADSLKSMINIMEIL